MLRGRQLEPPNTGLQPAPGLQDIALGFADILAA